MKKLFVVMAVGSLLALSLVTSVQAQMLFDSTIGPSQQANWR
jgi:hypothetical protein